MSKLAELVSEAGSVTTTRYRPLEFMPPHRHAYDKVSFMLSGSVTERRGATERQAEAGWVVTKPADVLHEDRVGGDGLCTLTLTATGEAWNRIVGDYRWLPMDRSIGRLIGLMTRRVEGPAAVIEEVLFALAAEVSREERASDDWYGKAVTVLRDKYDAPPSLKELADEVAVHPVTLSRAFAVRGTSKSEIVHKCRVQRAMRLLSSDSSFGCIAAELGYADSAHFTRSFKHWTSLSPREYRNRFATKR